MERMSSVKQIEIAAETEMTKSVELEGFGVRNERWRSLRGVDR